MQLGNYQMANRLSYFLWGTMPDSALFAAAQRAAVDRGRRADAGHAHARRHQGAGLRGRLHRGLAGRQRAGVAAQGSEALSDRTRTSRRRWSRVPHLRHHRGARQRPVRAADRHRVVGEPGAGRRSTAQGVTGTTPKAVTFDASQRARHPDSGRLSGRHRARATARRRCGAATRSRRACCAARFPTRPPTCRRRTRPCRG